MTAEALKTMTSPPNTRRSVTTNSQRSTLTRLAMHAGIVGGKPSQKRFSMVQRHLPICSFGSWCVFPIANWQLLHVAFYRFLFLSLLCQRVHHFLEHPPAMLIVLELVKAGASGSQKHHLAGRSQGRSALHRGIEGFGMNDFSRALDLGFDLGRRSTDCVHPFDASPEKVVEDGVVAALILAAENDMDVGGKRFQSLDGCIHIGGLRVVVVVDAANAGDILQPVLHGLEFAYRLTGLLRLRAHEHADRDSGKHVLHVMRTLEWDLGDRHDFPFAIAVAEENADITRECALLYLSLAAEPENLRLGPLRHRHASRIVGVEHREIIPRLVLEDTRLGRHVDFESAVPVEVIGRDVEHDCHLGVKGVNGFKLKAGDFKNYDRLRLGPGHQRYGRSSDISAHQW